LSHLVLTATRDMTNNSNFYSITNGNCSIYHLRLQWLLENLMSKRGRPEMAISHVNRGNSLLYMVGGVGLNKGAGKPAVLPKRVTRVRVRFSFLAHRGTPLPVPRYFGYVRVNSNKVVLIFIVFFLNIFSVCFQ
jgi:hypothetical protein